MSSQINKITRLKDFSNIVRGGSPRPAGDPTLYGGEIPFLKVADLTKDENVYVTTFENSITKLGLKNSRLVKKNTLLLTNSGATLGVPKICSFPTAFNDGIASFLSLRKVNNHFLYYYLKSLTKFFLEQASLGQGQPNLNIEIIGSVVINLPPLSEQTQIANYLDTKTQAIDKKINLLTTKIEYYKELRKTIINNAVTKGLDKNVKLKESEFIIPIHWEIKRLKDVYKTYTGNSIPDRGLYEIKENSRFYISTKDIDYDTGEINYDNGTYIQTTDKSFKIAYENSTLICLEGASAGNKIGFTTKDICFVNKLCCVFGNENRITNKYFYYFTLSEAFKQQFFGVLNGMIGGVSMNLLKNFNVIQPPKQEQTEIVTYLDAKTSTIDKITTNLQTQIETLKELRKTLINDVVTGKVKIVKD